jgi:hypothetical protein
MDMSAGGSVVTVAGDVLLPVLLSFEAEVCAVSDRLPLAGMVAVTLQMILSPAAKLPNGKVTPEPFTLQLLTLAVGTSQVTVVAAPGPLLAQATEPMTEAFGAAVAGKPLSKVVMSDSTGGGATDVTVTECVLFPVLLSVSADVMASRTKSPLAGMVALTSQTIALPAASEARGKLTTLPAPFTLQLLTLAVGTSQVTVVASATLLFVQVTFPVTGAFGAAVGGKPLSKVVMSGSGVGVLGVTVTECILFPVLLSVSADVVASSTRLPLPGMVALTAQTTLSPAAKLASGRVTTLPVPLT